MPDFSYTGSGKHILRVNQTGSATNGVYLTFSIIPATSYAVNAHGLRLKVDGAGMGTRWHVMAKISGGRAYSWNGAYNGLLNGAMGGWYAVTGIGGISDTVFVPIDRGNAKQVTKSINVATYQSNDSTSQANGNISVSTAKVADPTLNKPTCLEGETTVTVGASYINPEAFYNNATLFVDIYNGTTFVKNAYQKAFTGSTSQTINITDEMRGKTLKIYTKVVGKDGSTYWSTPLLEDIVDERITCFYKTPQGWVELDKIFYQSAEDVWSEITHAYANKGNWSRLG